MIIKEVIEYDYNYAEYIVTDGTYDLRCMCLSVPLADGKTPVPSMEVKKLYAFTFNGELQLKRIQNTCDFTQQLKTLQYSVRGHILDIKNAIVALGNFIISLEYFFPNGLPNEYSENDCVEFCVDRFDCVLEGYED